MRHKKVVITMGDPCGIGPEVILRSFPVMRRIRDTVFFIFGNTGSLSLRTKLPSNINLMDVPKEWGGHFKPGHPNSASAAASIAYLRSAVDYIKIFSADALVTGPISKEAVKKHGFRWGGHTEFLADVFSVKRVEMVFVSESLKVVLLTRHLSLKRAIASLNSRNIFECGSMMIKLLKDNFRIRNPKVAICGLNPHAGEFGLFGNEEDRIIKPAIKQLNKKFDGNFYGPFPADTVFLRAKNGEFDIVMAAYHDQGLIPFKLLEFDSGVNLTAGLPVIRTSPVHGTAFDIAAKRNSSPGSMIAAIRLASRLAAQNK